MTQPAMKIAKTLNIADNLLRLRLFMQLMFYSEVRLLFYYSFLCSSIIKDNDI